MSFISAGKNRPNIESSGAADVANPRSGPRPLLSQLYLVWIHSRAMCTNEFAQFQNVRANTQAKYYASRWLQSEPFPFLPLLLYHCGLMEVEVRLPARHVCAVAHLDACSNVSRLKEFATKGYENFLE
jgi:hypothetical protein